ncbi:hypothetical protein LSAT2_025316 [Lamellibrachia satsuma]|nr:hypothetical protein LSAT2_025316 [Lamellibrachia satsuma]
MKEDACMASKCCVRGVIHWEHQEQQTSDDLKSQTARRISQHGTATDGWREKQEIFPPTIACQIRQRRDAKDEPRISRALKTSATPIVAVKRDTTKTQTFRNDSVCCRSLQHCAS